MWRDAAAWLRSACGADRQDVGWHSRMVALLPPLRTQSNQKRQASVSGSEQEGH